MRCAWWAVLACVAAAGCTMERTEYRYRPDYVSINQGKPLEEEYYKPDGTRVVITSHIPGSVESATAEP